MNDTVLVRGDPSKSAWPDFARIRPHHLEEAAVQVHNEYKLKLSELEKALEENQEQFLSDPELLMEKLDQLEAPSDNVLNIVALYHTVELTPQWEKACAKTIRLLSGRPHERSLTLMDMLERVQPEPNSPLDWMVRHYLQQFRLGGVQHVQEATLQSLQSALDELQARFVAQREEEKRHGKPPSAASAREQLEDLYAFEGMQSQRAKLLGFDNYAHLVLTSEPRMASSVEEISVLHETIANRVVPIVEGTEIKVLQETVEEDIDMREYLTLDGVLGGLFGLARAMFGIRMEEEVQFSAGWHNDVRLFHVMDEDSDVYMASFYLDPYRRPIKNGRSLMCPLVSNRLSFISCNMNPPAWDHLPTDLQMEDALSLAHEFGHLLQFVLSGSDKNVLGAHNMPLDVSEMMPQFMEHWLFNEPVLQSFAHLSQAAEPIPQETFEKLKKQRSLRKALNMLHRVFLGQLELDMFSDAKDEGESLVAMQRRIAVEYISHDLPPRSDLTPMLEILENNATGKPVAQYRYLLGEVLSAEVFAMFQEHGVEEQARMRELGTQLKEAFLRPGATLDARKAFAELRGRDLSPEALFTMYGF